MSLVPTALRLIAQNLLTGKTWAEDAVMNMPLFPLAEVMQKATEKQKPVLVIYTPSTEFRPLGRDVDDGMQTVNFHIYIYMSPGKTIGEKGGIEMTIDNTNSANGLAFVARQVSLALREADSIWSQLWARFAVQYREVSADYILHEIESGVPIPCYAITYEIATIPEPQFGEGLNQDWEAFDQAIRTIDTEFADILVSFIKGSNSVPDYDLFRRQYGMSKDSAIKMGINPIPETISEDETEAAPLNSVDIVNDNS